MHGNGVTTQTKTGSYSIIYDDKEKESPYRAITMGHELLGHGRSLSLGRKQYQNIDAVQLENLLYRILKIKYVNDGTNHGGFIPNANELPNYR